MKRFELSSESGFSLIEMLIVLVLIGVLTTIALMQIGSSRTDFERQRISREFKIYLERARFDSVKRRPTAAADMARIVLNGPSSFTAFYDNDGDGVIRPGEAKVVDFTQRTNAVIQVSDAWSYPVTIRFDRRGHITAVDGGNNPVTPLFTICSDCSASSPDITRISVSSSGTVAELRAGQSPETLPTPTTTSSAPTTNCWVLAANTPSNTCITY